MSTEPQPEPAGTRVADEGVQQQAARPSDPAERLHRRVTGRPARGGLLGAGDGPSGALRATRDMPEPDSLGG